MKTLHPDLVGIDRLTVGIIAKAYSFDPEDFEAFCTAPSNIRRFHISEIPEEGEESNFSWSQVPPQHLDWLLRAYRGLLILRNLTQELGQQFPSATEGAPSPALPVEFAGRGFNLDSTIPADLIVKSAELMLKHGFALDTMTGVDWMAQGQMEVVYDYLHPDADARVSVRTRVPRDNPELPTISAVYQGANWHERETHDFFGIRFLGHPNLVPFLLPEDATYHPLRKDFAGASD